jgi:cytochrome c553
MHCDKAIVGLATAIAAFALAAPTVLRAETPAEQAAIERDWRMQDGIGTPRAPSTYPLAVGRLLERGDRLLADLQGAGVPLAAEAAEWQRLRAQWKELAAAKGPEGAEWEDLWRRTHVLRRRIALANPLAKTGPIAFVKQVPSIFSHQLTQYYGSCARPGGGVFVLERPGESMQCRQLAAGALPPGSCQHLDVSWDGRRIVFAHCRAETVPRDREEHLERFYHLYELDVANENRGPRQMSDGPFDDFSPRYLPDGRLIFISTRRGGFHRCGRGPCAVYTLATCEADGRNPRVLSFHETHEWDPAVLNDGRIIYTRWDYVDRDAVHFQQLWTVRPDGSDVRIFYGNYTLNPVGIWEARPVPGSSKVMATAGAHHAMTAGSIVLLDVTKGADGQQPLVRLTPDVPFPESESVVLPAWRSPGDGSRPPQSPEAERWPGHCYRSPYPLSEKHFLVAYSFDSLIGEPNANPKNMFGLYLADAWGNKELLYRDAEICSLWPMPLRPRAKPTQVSSLLEAGTKEGTFLVQNVYRGWPALPEEKIARLRVVQVLPKSTPHANDPTVGLANASPGRQVLGTVPVEADGSAWFRAPAGVALAFQALDRHGQAVQTMRSLTYLQPGENSGCIGCHETRTAAPPPDRMPLAFRRPPSVVQPGPDGSKPFSYPRLVQPVLDAKCVSCHGRDKPAGNIALTGEPQGRYTVSYNALAPRVPYSAWGGDFAKVNGLTTPDRFGARGSPMMKLLLAGHEKVALTPEEIERLATWMDTNALFYGTFDPADQARQQRGERIAGPKIE